MTIVATSPSVTLRHPIILWIAQLRAWVFLAFLILFFEVWSRATEGTSFLFNVYNIQSILVFATAPLLLALGQTFVIISAGIDLSLGFVMGLSSVIAAHGANFFTEALGLPPFLAMLGAILCGMAIAIIPGLVNGLLVSRLQIPPFIGTLGMYGVARGAAYLFAGGMTVAIDNDWYSAIGNGRVLGVPVLVILTGVACLILHYILSQTRFGQHTYALGASKPAANRAGIDVKWLTLRIYLLSAVMAGVAGAMYTGRFTAGAPQAGEPLLLDSIAAVVIGGASLFGGSGTIAGTIAGALVIAVIQYGLVFINVEPFWQFIAVGVVIIISVFVDQTQRRASSEDEPLSNAEPILSVRNVSKAFGAVQALNAVSLEVYPGQVVALAGDNGAGKSTIIKAISGVFRHDEGEILLDGNAIDFATPHEARESGIETIYQDLALADNLSIGENIFLGREPKRKLFGFLPILDRARMAKAAKEAMASLDFHVTRLEAPVAAFSGGQRQAIAIGRAIYWNARLVIMDEPTAALGVPEQRRVLALIKSLRAQGKGIIFISHNLRDIFEVADEIVVFRHGERAGARKPSETTHDEIVKLMVGS